MLRGKWMWGAAGVLGILCAGGGVGDGSEGAPGGGAVKTEEVAVQGKLIFLDRFEYVVHRDQRPAAGG